MSDFNSRWVEAQQGKTGQGQEWDAFRSVWPNLADAILGRFRSGEDPGRPPMKILLFAEADKLKFMLSPLLGDLVAFGTFPDVTGGFDGLEAELAKGAFEWKKRRR